MIELVNPCITKKIRICKIYFFEIRAKLIFYSLFVATILHSGNKVMKCKILFALMLLVGTLYAGSATASSEAVKQTDNTTIRLFHNGVNEVLAQFEIKPDWHISWSNPGDVGQPTTVRAENSTVEVVAQSTPQVRTLFEIMHEYLYENTAYYSLKLDNLNDAELTFDFVECSDVCKPEKLSFQLSNIKQTDAKEWQSLQTRATATFPQKITLTSPSADNLLTLNFPADTPISFAAPQKDMIDEESVEITPTEKGIRIKWRSDKPDALKQALIITPEQSYLADIEYQTNRATLLLMILLAFLGGIILNAMPCVFPILSLKIWSLLKQTRTKRQALKNALAYTAGVLISFMLLSALLVWLKQHGENLGWGFQLQSPWFVGSMAVLFLLLFCFMVGWLKFPELASQRMHKLANVHEFATGFFAVLIASPCTGPFMGAAIGYAFMRGSLEIFAVFSGLALGYALPYALIELYPQPLRRIMPKPGAWMRKLQIILAVPLLLTSLWLGSVWYAQIDTDDTFASELNWQPYDADEIAELNAAHENIFVDFTADWCLTCKFNHKIILDTDRFAKFVTQNNVHLFVADITEHNPQYNTALQAYGRDSIPLYVYYHDGDYEILPLFFRIKNLPH